MAIKKQTRKFLLIGLVIFLLPVISSIVKSQWNNYVAKNEIVKQRQDSEKASESQVKSNTEYIKETLGVTKNIGSSKIDVCYLNHSDGGWMIAYWYQDCYLRYVDGFETSLSRDEVIARIVANPKSKELFSSEYDYGPDGCLIYQRLFYVPANYAGMDYDCFVPNQLQGIWSVRGAITNDGKLSTKKYRSFDNEMVNRTVNIIWVTHEDHYYHEQLGCGIGLFCSSPRAKPVHPTL
jgi:hypothetical protein